MAPVNQVDKSSVIPYYSQLADILRSQIEEGDYKDSGQLPSERELCQTYDVSRSTVRQAIQTLKEEGLIRKVKGLGTKINLSRIEQNLLGHHNFDLQMEHSGHDATVVLLNDEVLTGPGRVQRLMELPESTNIFKVVRLRVVDGEPIFIEKIYMPQERFPGLKARHFWATDVFLKQLGERYQTKISKAQIFLEPVLLDGSERDLLDIAQSPAPGLMVERISYDADNQAVAVTKRIFGSDRCRHILTVTSR